MIVSKNFIFSNEMIEYLIIRIFGLFINIRISFSLKHTLEIVSGYQN